MPVYDHDLGILGGGAAGIAAAKGAARIGARTILIGKAERSWGGNLHSGCVPSKTLIRSAEVWSLARRSAEFGLPGLELPPVSLAAVMGRGRSVAEAVRGRESPGRFRQLGVTVRFGEARFLDGHAVSLEGERVTAGAWIIATGSRPAIPSLEGLEEVPYRTTDTVFSLERLPERLLVLGGGPEGVELAQAFRRFGSEVSLVESERQLLPSEDEDMADFLEARLEAEGVRVFTGAIPLKVERDGSSVRLVVTRTAGGAEPWTIEGDLLLVATGRTPNTGDLDLPAAGVPFYPWGIPTYATMRTPVRDIYACGDVNGMFPYAHVAEYEARIAVSNALLRLSANADYSRVPWCTYTDPEVASVGFNEKRARAGGVEYHLQTSSFQEVDRALAEGAPEGRIKVLVGGNGRVLGCQIAGSRAGELIHEWTAAVNVGARIKDMEGWVHAYPTLSGVSKGAVDSFDSSRFTGDRTRRFFDFLLKMRRGR